jgi:hypothetical protein
VNGELERRLGEFIGRVDQWIENFDNEVKPQLVTKAFCELQRKDDRLDAVTRDKLAARAFRRVWANRFWSAVVAALLLIFGHWWGERGDRSATADETGDVPRHRVESSR